MNFETLWIIIENKNVNLRNDSETITMTKKGFKKALKLAFDKGLEARKPEPKVDSSIFNDIFGGNLF
jgi:hypothetical protein